MSTLTAQFPNASIASNKLALALQTMANAFVAKMHAKRTLQSVAALERMASNYAAVQPNLAAELRFIASRG